MTSSSVRRPCHRRPGRSSMGRITQRAPKPVRAAERRETPETTPTKRPATLRPAEAPDPGLSGRTTAPLALSWNSLLRWRMRRHWGIPSTAPPPASRRTPARRRTPPKRSAPPDVAPALNLLSSSRSYATSTSFASWDEPPGYFLRPQGPGRQLLRWTKCAFASDLPQDFVWMFVTTSHFHFR